MAEAESRSPMFTDELERQLDSGLRVPLPKDWRSLLITEFFLITDSSKSFIKAFPRSEYETFIAKIESDPTLDATARNELHEEIASSCKLVELDNAGRLTLPSKFCEEIGIVGKNATVVLKGSNRTFNIWNPAKLAAKQLAKQQLAEAGHAPQSGKKLLGV
jgi:DNA-binding transcriptional regulator/RsmH inhibitor MraZ